jgi:hypothetical protein
MKKWMLLILLLLVLAPVSMIVADQPTVVSCEQATVAPPSTQIPAPATDFAQWHESKGLTPAPSCGPNFCTQAQKTQCAQSCRHHPFVGLECCEATCTSFCNCGSVVPTGGC